MGPLAIKLGQLLSTRRDLIPPEVLSAIGVVARPCQTIWF